MRILYCGSGQFGIACLKAINASNHELVHIFTQPARPAGRGKKLTLTPVAEWAVENSISVTETEDINSTEMIQKAASFKPDLMVVIAFGQKISDQLIALPEKGAINVHASLLPKYRGAAPINWAIINGENQTGVSIITLASKMDAGQIVAQKKISIVPDENSQQLHDRLAELAAPLLTETIDKIQDGTAVYKDQDPAKATRAPKLKKSDGFINFDDSAETIINRIRGLWPWPGAQVDYVSKKTKKCSRVTIAKAEAVVSKARQADVPGTLDEDLNVICTQGKIRILRIKPSGGGLMDFAAFANGRDASPGDVFIPIKELE